jgi:hypothetical protein
MKTTSLLVVLLAALTACELDNYTQPESILEGRIVHQGQAVGIRDNAIQLELWQDGYELRTQIPVFVRQDGTFTAKLFDGSYKLVRKQNNGPWQNDPDTIRIDLARSQTLDVPVQPFFTIQNGAIQRSGTQLTATLNVQQVVAGRQVERIGVYVGTTQFVDARFNSLRQERAVTNETGLGQQHTLAVDLAGVAQGRDVVFARIGVKTAGVEELIYTHVQQIQLR